MGFEPVNGPAGGGWFEFYDDTITVDPSTDADRAFLSGLRARAAANAWLCDPDDTWAYHELHDGRHLLRVGIRLATWLTCGVEFDGERIVGSQCYNEIPFDLAGPVEAGVEGVGSVHDLVDRAAGWFEWLLSAPIELRRWVEDGTAVVQWGVAGDGRSLTVERIAPPNRPPDSVETMRAVPGWRAHGDDEAKPWWRFGKRSGK